MSYTLADSAKSYLDYLDKEMTIQGILSVFCVGFSAAVFDRVLRVTDTTNTDLIKNLQTNSLSFVLAAIIATMVAALFFYCQRSKLAWLHGQISLAVTRTMKHIPTPPDGYEFGEGLEIGDSWSLWNSYLMGWSFLSVAAANALFAVFFDHEQKMCSRGPLIAILFLVAIVYDVIIFFRRNNRDKDSAKARGILIENIRAAKKRRLAMVGKKS